jgi:hypothetical protein
VNVHRTLKLTATGESFQRVSVGKRVYLAARLRPGLPNNELGHKLIVIQSRSAGSSKSVNLRVCAQRGPLQRSESCWMYVNSSVPVKEYFQAFLIDTGFDGRHYRTLVKSAVVTVNWVGDINPSEATIQANDAVRTENLTTGALTCTGSGYSQGTSCYVNVAQGSSVQLKASLDVVIPSNWKWTIIWELSVGNDQPFACPAQVKTCGEAVTEPTLPATSPIALLHIDTPNGATGPGMYVVPCKPGEMTNGHPCPS